MKKLLIPENEAEALALKKLLEDHGIPGMLHSYRDSAYDGIFQNQYGWGALMVPEDDLQRAAAIVNEWRAAAPRGDELPWQEP
ncbi:MAG: DUF2007 domain-containing protein [Proteobacteria bacterium]|nr:DUF2007 domain-containing protein [Pseudomonadota bacterium]MBU1688563.1 DUF2007 domain-containing protein [Pseudomonadota bacterium]